MFLKIKSFTPAFLLLVLPATNLCAQQKETAPANNEAEFEQQYQERITKDRLFGTYIPKNLDDALLQLDKLIAPDNQLMVKNIPEDSICIYLHSKLGQWIILNWGFYGGSRLSNYLRSAGVTYPDDMADLILIAYHRHLNQKPVVIKNLALSFRDKRKKSWQEEQKKHPVLYEETRKKDRR
ncbi:MAG: hypothetical protein IPL65_03505 [Lewinellaceae bacterium]|nr:hypothetical protein [Lewinellaceae bacterium]